MINFWISKVYAVETEVGNVTDWADYIDTIYTKYALPAGLALGVGMIVYAGIKYINSGGDPQKVSEAKEVMISTILGVLVLLLAGLILNTLAPAPAP